MLQPLFKPLTWRSEHKNLRPWRQFVVYIICLFINLIFYHFPILLRVFSTCDLCMKDLLCGYCYMDSPNGPEQGSCLPSLYDNYISADSGRCNHTELPGKLTWAYDYCPTPFAWMSMVGLILYLLFFAPGNYETFNICTNICY